MLGKSDFRCSYQTNVFSFNVHIVQREIVPGNCSDSDVRLFILEHKEQDNVFQEAERIEIWIEYQLEQEESLSTHKTKI